MLVKSLQVILDRVGLTEAQKQQVIPEGAGPVNPVVLVVDLSFGVLRRFLGASR
jgi:hypothetical protein